MKNTAEETKTLQEIKDDYAKELGWNSFPHLLLNVDGTREMLDRDYNEVAKRYAQSVAEDLQKRIIQDAFDDPYDIRRYANSIRNVEIILP